MMVRFLSALLFIFNLLICSEVFAFPDNAIDYSYTSPDTYEHKTHRVAIFAAFSEDGTIPDYVVYYLKELKKSCDAIVYISDNPVIPTEADKIKDLVIHSEFKKHREYDFGSYKRGLAFLREHRLLESEDSLVLLNDSCYGPIFPLEDYFRAAENRKDIDFWGLSSDAEFGYHLQSYFMVFLPKVLLSGTLDSFLNTVQPQDDVLGVLLSYEVPLTGYLRNLGFVSAPWVQDNMAINSSEYTLRNKTFYPYTLIKNFKFPLVKRKTFSHGTDFSEALREKPDDVLELLKQINYPLYQIIQEDIKKGSRKR